jgi:hypothetical protein
LKNGNLPLKGVGCVIRDFVRSRDVTLVADHSEAANRQAIERIAAASPFLIGVERARNAIPDLSPLDFLHAGPPLTGWHEVCGALRGAIVGPLLRSGSSLDAAAAEGMAAREVRLISAQDRFALGTYGSVITWDTPVLVVENRADGRRPRLGEGLAYTPEVRSQRVLGNHIEQRAVLLRKIARSYALDHQLSVGRHRQPVGRCRDAFKRIRRRAVNVRASLNCFVWHRSGPSWRHAGTHLAEALAKVSPAAQVRRITR